MIKKISSWVFGSFFRTMGRFFFFLFFGFLVAMIIQKNDWSSIHWTDLFGLEYVKADTITSVSYVDFYNSSAYTSRYAYSNRHQYVNIYNTDNSTLSTLDFYYQDDKRNYDYITFNYLISGTQDVTSTDNNKWYCNQYETTSGNPYYYECQYFNSYDPQRQTFAKHYTITMSAYLYSVDGTTSTTACEVYDTYFRCPVINTNTNNWHLIVTYSNTTPGDWMITTITYFQISQMVTHYSYDTNAIIDNQNQIANQTITTITDSNTTEANSTASNFFENFTSQDNGGISSIITAPLQAISGLVSAQCVQIELPLPYLENKTLILPCMSAIYQQHFGGVFTLYQTIIFGAIAYRMLISIFMMIQGFKNPDDDKIEVVDL